MTGGVRAPGRHAARRPVASLLHRMRASAGTGPLGSVLDHAGLRAAHLVWVAFFAAVALAGTSWWLVQAKESVVVTPVAAPPGAPASSAATPSDAVAAGPGGAAVEASAQGVGAEVVVDVTGRVRRPGIVVLPPGSRVVDALKAAGGARRGVDLQSLNLARVLVDGEQIVVGAPVSRAPSSPSGAPAPGTSALVNLNSAGQSELEALPGVGPVTASAILEWRTRHGGFTSVEDLLEVRGIGEVTLERLSALVTV